MDTDTDTKIYIEEQAEIIALYEMEALSEEFKRIKDKMRALARRLYASLKMRDGETVADFIRRLDPDRPFESDKPQALIASIACASDQKWCEWCDSVDLRSTIRLLNNYVLSRVYAARSAPAAPFAEDPL